ncbi:MAG TPA: PepSY domain-containing protein [Acetobacteraceae bacterium]|nr:PepSY domain-containing protein [Acetobacteraceae bacterium]
MRPFTKSMLAATAIILGTAPLAFAYDGQALAGSAKISMDQAQSLAHKAQPGKIVGRELEKEKGGSGLRYSFDVKTSSGKTHEVGIDAETGKLLENSVEGAHAD